MSLLGDFQIKLKLFPVQEAAKYSEIGGSDKLEQSPSDNYHSDQSLHHSPAISHSIKSPG